MIPINNHTSVLHCEISISVTRFCLSGGEIIKTAFSFVQDIFSIMKTFEILLIRVRILFSLPTENFHENFIIGANKLKFLL